MDDDNNAAVRELFFRALDKNSPEELSAFLDEACSHDPLARSRVERLLGAHDRAGNFLGGVPKDSATTEHSSIDEQPGQLIGPYKLLRQIGEGGFGVVFLAEQTAPVRREVALKIVKPGMDTWQVIARFEAERQVLAMMDHPNIAKVFDAGTTGGGVRFQVSGVSEDKPALPLTPDTRHLTPHLGRPYFVMELVHGVPITEYCDQCNITTRERLELFVTVCQAVQHAHQKGIIHRDIKPTNVLVAMQDGQPAPKIIDFGVAKAIEQRLTEHTRMTAFAQMVGTPLYMSPEQAELSPLGVDTRSDIYSLGVVLYELLTGATPFDKDRLHAASYDELRRIIREEEPPRPSARITTLAADKSSTIAERRRTDSRRLGQAVRGELDWIVMKCLEKDRNRRYETPSSLARDIERYLGDEPVEACPPSAIYRLGKYARRNRTLLAAGGAIAAALVVGLGLSAWQYLRATTESARAKAVSGLLQEMLSSADAGRVKGSDYTLRELLGDFSVRLGNQLTDQPEVEADIHATIGRAFRSLLLPDVAQPHFEKAIELRRQVDSHGDDNLAAILVDYAWNLHDQNRLAEAETQLRTALEIYDRRSVTGGPIFHTLEILQHTLISAGRNDDAERVTQEALAVASQENDDFVDKASLLHRYAGMRNKQGRFVEAEQLAREAIEIHHRVRGKRHPETAWALKTLADALRGQHKLGEAELVFRDSLAIFRRSYGENSPMARGVLDDLKAVLRERGDAAAIDALIAEEAARVDHSDSPLVFLDVAKLLLTDSASNDTRKLAARRMVRRAIDGYDRAAAESNDNLDRRLEAAAGYVDVAKFCLANPECAPEIDEAYRRMVKEFDDSLAESPDSTRIHNVAADALYYFAVVQARLGDLAGYRASCRKLSGLPFNKLTGTVKSRPVWTPSLAPGGLDDPSQVVKLCQEFVAHDLLYDRSYGAYLLGAAHFRTNEFQLAAERLDESIATFPTDSTLVSHSINYPRLFLAMTKWRLGQKDAARQLLLETLPDIEEELKLPSSGWNRRATLELLRSEAKALIGPKEADEAVKNENRTRDELEP